MPAPPARTEISDTYPLPSNATARTGFGRLWDYATTLLGSTGLPADARVALGLLIGYAFFQSNVGYIRFPAWLGSFTIQWGVTAVVTDGGGGASIGYPMAFPVSPMFTTAWRGIGGGAPASIVYPTDPATASFFSIVLRNSSTGAAIAGTGVDVAWFALGV